LDKWDIAHMQVAEIYAKLSSAVRMKVGAVIVKDNRIISIGYNGMPSGWDNNCEYRTWKTLSKGASYLTKELKTKDEVLHAETNAIAKVAKSTESAEDAVLYSTCAPCLDCAKLIHQSGISRVVYGHNYKSDEGLTFLEKCGIIIDTENKPDPDDLPWSI